ncbi:ankyrin repeat-containing domain protein [Phakopsora pachyrhizi]|uniref:Ankyrin repeat-containing domain protein n=1 Tax=Phakopsora pachyrhizi TaxID=170000 RepID=A0AAV0BGH2_PHAPC|nr:ankyrin repeat-containing domain protein [Phakopsora pachyrhizi]CAH7685699.1 ankyrin repeat-containing domain protein [Phakopsora pachyrhizi]
MVNLNYIERKNIWVAASDGEIDRVKELIESGVEPTTADENSYTPLHAAASWGHIEILRYLCSVGGDINITDSDGDTPLFSVEDLETARVIIELGGDPNHKNFQGLTPAESLLEEYPVISNYLRDLTGEPHLPSIDEADLSTVDQLGNDPTNLITSSLINQVRNIMTEADVNGESMDSKELDEKLREAVTRSVDESVGIGKSLATSSSSTNFANLVPSSSLNACNKLDIVSENDETVEDQNHDTNKRQRN